MPNGVFLAAHSHVAVWCVCGCGMFGVREHIICRSDASIHCIRSASALLVGHCPFTF